MLDKIKLEKKSSYFLGDWNINLINIDKHIATQEFVDVMYSHAMFPTITKPTRVSSSSATLIDNIFCNTIWETPSALSGILYTDISDHFPVFYIDYASQVKHIPDIIKKTYLL